MKLYLEITQSQVRVEKFSQSRRSSEVKIFWGQPFGENEFLLSGDERRSFKNFLGRRNVKHVNLERLLAVGGEGIVQG